MSDLRSRANDEREDINLVRYAYAITGALLLGGATATLTLNPSPGSAQTAQNEPGMIQSEAPRGGSPMSFADMVIKLQPAVVNISTKQTITQQAQANPFAGTPFEGLFGGQGGGQGGPQRREGASLGSGFIISSDGYVVTNNHVIDAGRRGATVDSITVTLPGRKEYEAKVVGRDPTSDLAVLKIEANNLPFVRLGDSTRARVGDWIVAIGNPFGLDGTVTAGIVSAVHRVTGGGPERFIQTDASINQGNSGGPMFNLRGEVIGINSQIFSQSGGNIGIGFAIPTEDAKPIIDRLMKGQAIRRGYLGVQIAPVTADIASALGIPRNQGEIIASVEPTGPAGRAGVRVGDVVTKVNGTQVTPDTTLSYLVANVDPGSTARLEVLRNGRPQTLTATVATRPAEEQLAATLGGESGDAFPETDQGPAPSAATGNGIGVTVQPLTPAIARAVGVDSTVRGLVVAQVSQTSDAAQKLRRGDVISAVNGSPVTSAAELSAAVNQARRAGREQILLLVQGRGAPQRFIPVRIGNG